MAAFARQVVSIVDEHRRRTARAADEEDLFAAGQAGLWRALQKYHLDNATDAQFGTYAEDWIRGHVLSVPLKGSGATVTDYGRRWLRQFSTAKSTLTARLRREPTLQEIADEMHAPLSRAKELASRAQVSMGAYSLSTPEVGARVNNQTGRRWTSYEQRAEASAIVTAALDWLPPRERDVLERRFGFRSADGKGEAPSNIGRELHPRMSATELDRWIKDILLQRLKRILIGMGITEDTVGTLLHENGRELARRRVPRFPVAPLEEKAA